MEAKQRNRLLALVVAAIVVGVVMYALGWRLPGHYAAPAIVVVAGFLAVLSPGMVDKRLYIWLTLIVANVAAASFWPYPIPALGAFGLVLGADALENLLTTS